jgi:hypothetical protein
MRVTAVLVALLITIATGWLSRAVGDSWLVPKPRIFASQFGDYGLRMIPGEPNASATLFTLSEKAEEQTAWQGPLVNIPHRVYISDNGRVVTVDTYARVGYEHALVTYDEKGKVLADYRLEDLLTAEEIKAHVVESVSSRWWNTEAQIGFSSEDGERFVIKLPWGKVIAVDLNTGKLVPQV